MTITRNDGFILQKSFTVDEGTFDTLSSEGVAERLYINVHSMAFGGGEVRGQLSVESDARPVDGPLVLGGALDGGQEVPANASDASGEGQVSIAPFRGAGETSVSVELTVWGLGIGPAQAMHIHNAAAGSNGGVVLNLDTGGALQSETPAALKLSGITPFTDWTGTAAADSINGDFGIDLVRARKGNDTVKGGNGADEMDGGNGKDLLQGGNGADLLLGGKGGDRLFGGKGNDVIKGGAGNDLIVTGKGKDTILYNMFDPSGDGTDRIRDFSDQDSFAFVGSGASKTRFSKVDPSDEGANIKARANVVVLTDTPMTMQQAQDALESLSDFTRDGIFAYFDSDVDKVLLAYAEELGDADGPTTVLARLDGGIDLLDDLNARDFDFVGRRAYDDEPGLG